MRQEARKLQVRGNTLINHKDNIFFPQFMTHFNPYPANVENMVSF